MALITSDDIALYTPSVSLSGDALNGAILQAQALAESHLGANRPLEEGSHREVITLSSAGRCFLSRLPIKADSVSIEVRGGDTFVYGLEFTAQEWRAIDTTDYEVDYISGELWVRSFVAAGIYGNYRNTTSPYRPSRPTRKANLPQVRVTYSTGIESSAVDSTTIALKASLCNLVALRESGAFSQGYKSFELMNFYNAEFGMTDGLTTTNGATGEPMSLMDEYLAIFRKYRPREFTLA